MESFSWSIFGRIIFGLVLFAGWYYGVLKIYLESKQYVKSRAYAPKQAAATLEQDRKYLLRTTMCAIALFAGSFLFNFAGIIGVAYSFAAMLVFVIVIVWDLLHN